MDEIKAWRESFDFPLKGRNGKPRQFGLTMIIDKGLGITETRDLMELSADYIDFLKLTFGTSAFYSTRLLREKIELVTSYGVDIFPGGTFLEIAVLQGRLDDYLRRAKELGFTAIEVSDGTIDMDNETRRVAIAKACDLGFKVIGEVGKKDNDEQVSQTRMHELVEMDLANGASWVIVEGRESGRGVVIYDSEGHVKVDEMEALIDGIKDPSKLIWEAPLKNQQEHLILRFGPNVNLGNIQPADILALEALRVGLRGDTLKAVIRGRIRRDDFLDSLIAS